MSVFYERCMTGRDQGAKLELMRRVVYIANTAPPHEEQTTEPAYGTRLGLIQGGLEASQMWSGRDEIKDKDCPFC